MKGLISLTYFFNVTPKMLGLSENCTQEEFIEAMDKRAEQIATLFDMQTDHIVDEIVVEII